ncbi:MAG: hypothetical protein JWP37_3486 [Mucilaginibacter sp.]|nr:hypothetical protein [Mucilaginibacter sp.]
MQAASNRNNTIDVVRLIASLLIITLHISYSTANETLAGLYRLAGRCGVPFFFMVSGYFYQRSLDRSPLFAFKKNFTKIFNLIIIANLVYIPRSYILTHHFYSAQYITVGDCFNLWYLYALLIGIGAVYLLFKWKVNHKILFGLIFFIIAAELLTDSHSYLLARNTHDLFVRYVRPFISIPFMLIGALFYKNNHFKKLINKDIGLILLISGFIIQIAEAELISFYTHKSIVVHQFLIGTFIYSIGIFILSLSLDLKSSLLGKAGEKYSLFIYLYHPVLITILDISNYTSVFNGNVILLFPIPIFFITLFAGVFIDKYIPWLFLVLNGSIKEAFNKKKAPLSAHNL